VSVDDVQADEDDVDQMLLPLLRGEHAPSRSELPGWTRELILDCRELLSMVLPLTDDEREFLSRLNDRGEIAPELLTSDSDIQSLVRSHPGLSWKALNVRRQARQDQPQAVPEP
jgi:hypothetical protein